MQKVILPNQKYMGFFRLYERGPQMCWHIAVPDQTAEIKEKYIASGP